MALQLSNQRVLSTYCSHVVLLENEIQPNTRVMAVTVEEIWTNMNLKGHKMKSSARKHNGIKP